MMLTWQDFPGAPAPGTQICAVVDIPRSGVLSVVLGEYPVLVLTCGMGLHVYVNACPHQFLPLDQRSNGIVSADGKRLMCSNHQAEFNISDGNGVTGLGLGLCLAQVPFLIQDDQMLIVGA